MISNRILLSALFFAIFAASRHTAVYYIFPYVSYLFLTYCFSFDYNGKVKFSFLNLAKLASIVLGVAILAVLPFLRYLMQILAQISGGKHEPLHKSSIPNLNLLFSLIEWPLKFTYTRAYPIPFILKLPLMLLSNYYVA